jgi:glucan 1,3-beta-glucosidase
MRIEFNAARLLLLLCPSLLYRVALCQDEPVRGVSLGGWLLTEEWMTPSLFQSTGTADEWHLCNALGKDRCLSTLQDHWSSFYKRNDLEDIKNAGLNAIRIPIGYWAVDLLDYEPYVAGQYPYLIQAVYWAAEIGLSVLIDLHGAPGSQNGQDNSGLIGPVQFPSNNTNGDRSLNVLRNLTAEFSQDIYNGTVTGIELLNEPRLSSSFSMAELQGFYADGAATIQNASLSTQPNVTIHGKSSRADAMSDAD